MPVPESERKQDSSQPIQSDHKLPEPVVDPIPKPDPKPVDPDDGT